MTNLYTKLRNTLATAATALALSGCTSTPCYMTVERPFFVELENRISQGHSTTRDPITETFTTPDGSIDVEVTARAVARGSDDNRRSLRMMITDHNEHTQTVYFDGLNGPFDGCVDSSNVSYFRGTVKEQAFRNPGDQNLHYRIFSEMVLNSLGGSQRDLIQKAFGGSLAPASRPTSR